MLSVAIQAGGESRRMGENKALKSFLGRALIQRVAERVAPIADELFLVVSRPADYAFLDLPLFPDRLPGRGPLGGLYTALVVARHPIVAMVACDMPFVSAPLLKAAADLLVQEEADVVIAQGEDGYEPLHAVYRRAACLPAVKAMLDSGQRKVISWFPQVRVRVLRPEEIARLDPRGLAFWNLNTPEEFARAEAYARLLEPSNT